MNSTGQCLCGAVTFAAEGVEAHIHACHCSICRGWSGGPMLAANVASVTFTGGDKVKRYQSSEWAERGFCTDCGGNLFYRLLEQDMYIMCVGCFDDADQFQLDGEIYIDEKPDTYSFAGEHPRLTGEEFLASMNSD